MVRYPLEKWLARQDIPVEDTTTIDKYIRYLQDELGMHGGSLAVGEAVYREQFEVWGDIDIRPFAWHTVTPAGIAYRETRYTIEGIPGAWGRENALLFGASIAEETGRSDIARTLRGWYEAEFGGE